MITSNGLIKHIHKVLISLLFLVSSFSLFAQLSVKQVLDTSDIRSYKTLRYSRFVLSGDGKYIAFDNSHTVLSFEAGKTIKSLDNTWERVIDDVQGEVTFSSDSHLAIFLGKDKRLNLIYLGKDTTDYISNVDSYKLLSYFKGKDNLLIDKRSSGGGIIIRDLYTGKEYNYGSPDQFLFSSRSSSMIVNDTIAGGQSVYYFDNGKAARKIWSGPEKIKQLTSTKSGECLGFCTESSIYYFEKGKTNKAVKVNIPHSDEFDGLKLLGQLWFSPSEHLLLFRMDAPLLSVDPNVNPVEVYSYVDRSFYLSKAREALTYDCLYDCVTGKVVRVCEEGEQLKCISSSDRSLLISKISANEDEYYWNKKSAHGDYVLSLDNGGRVPVKTILRTNEMSPSGLFVVGQNEFDGDLFCLDVKAGITRNITEALKIPGERDMDGGFGSSSREISLGSWIAREDEALVYDRYDIWKIDLRNQRPAINLTNGYGRKHHTVLRLLKDNSVLEPGKDIILTAFNEDTKDAGFYKVKDGVEKDPELLSMGRYVYEGLQKCGPNKWVVKRMSTTEAPNFFWSGDLRSFYPVTAINPEKHYYWHSTELINYKTKDGVNSQAIFYKPENFDPSKKYPVLFTFYEKESSKLNEYQLPSYTEQFSFNIPLMVSRGYLVCVPDIHFKIGETAHSIVDCVEGAADYISKFPYVDSALYGACGGSFGGYGVNCLAAFGHKFKAIAPISGVAELISAYGSIPPNFNVAIHEAGQMRMGVGLSDDPIRYIRNSPVAFAKSVTAAVLIVTTLFDPKVNVQQGIEWFVSLRRQGKQVWMLRYKGAPESHGIYELNDRKDLSIRMSQFFDHYLKGKPTPIWMTREMTPQEAGVISGYDYNPAATSPPPNLLKGSSN